MIDYQIVRMVLAHAFTSSFAGLAHARFIINFFYIYCQLIFFSDYLPFKM